MDTTPFFPELYFKGDDFAAREITLTTREITLEKLHSEKGDEDKIVLYFVETKAKAVRDGRPKNEKRMVLSKTLWVDFAALFNSKDTKDWNNKRIAFFQGKAIKGGKMVIRARLAANQNPTQADPASNIETTTEQK